MTITRNKVEIELTEAEIFDIYSKQNHLFLLKDAKTQLDEFLSNNCDYDKDEFETHFGVDFDLLCDPASDNYLLEELAISFECHCDCNRADNDKWYDIVRDRLELFAAAVS